MNNNVRVSGQLNVITAAINDYVEAAVCFCNVSNSQVPLPGGRHQLSEHTAVWQDRALIKAVQG